MHILLKISSDSTAVAFVNPNGMTETRDANTLY